MLSPDRKGVGMGQRRGGGGGGEGVGGTGKGWDELFCERGGVRWGWTVGMGEARVGWQGVGWGGVGWGGDGGHVFSVSCRGNSGIASLLPGSEDVE